MGRLMAADFDQLMAHVTADWSALSKWREELRNEVHKHREWDA